MRRRAVAVVVALIAWPVAGAVPRLDPGLARKVDPVVIRRIASGVERVRVIVEVNAPPEATRPLPPRGTPIGRARLDAVAEATGRELEALRRAFPGQVRVEARYRLFPAFAVTVPAEAVAALAARPGVVRISADPVLHAKTAEGIPLIGADVLHAAGYDGTGTAVAIVDTGIDPTHPSLGGGPIPNGKVVYGKDTADNDDDPTDCAAHGTAVASIAAGLPVPADGFAGGVAPGAAILAYKASPDGNCGNFSGSDVIEAIDDALLHRDEYNLVAINMSLGGSTYDGPCDGLSDFEVSLYRQAVAQANAAGVAVVAASGNENDKTGIGFPACLTGVVSVASVYDTDAPIGLRYPDANNCSDNPLLEGHVTCYSNTSAFLDLFAPSELLTAAKPGGYYEVDLSATPAKLGFGGTSGATPYVTGAFALLAQFRPGLPPLAARLLLELTGVPTTDPANGIVAPRVDVAAATSAGTVELPTQFEVPIPNGTGEAAVSTIDVLRSGPVQSVRVEVRIAHPAPEDLVVTLVAPDGTRVVLHDHGPGSAVPGGTGDLVGQDGIATIYPDRTPPVEDLGTLAGHEASGTWTLEVLDDDPSSQSGVDPVLVAWALDLEVNETPVPPSSPAAAVPVAIHQGGAAGTFWVTDLRLLNPSASETVAGSLYLVPEGADGTQEFHRMLLSLPPNTLLALDDVVATRFGLDGLQGNLLVQTSGPLLVTSRTYNTARAAGTYGQFIALEDVADALAMGDGPAYLIHLAQNARYRTNVGFSEVGGRAATVTLTVHDGATGAVLAGPVSYAVKAYSNRQLNRLLESLGVADTDNAYLAVEVSGEGKVLGYASVVDGDTGDAIYVPLARPTPGPAMVPVVARLGGKAGTNWVSDLRILNAGTAPETVTLEYRPAQGDPGSPSQLSREIAPGEVLALDDVVGTALGQAGTKGSLRVVPAGTQPLVITSRTYNKLTTGTYGQFVGPARAAAGPGQSLVVLHLAKDAVFRSNVGVVETSGSTVTVRLALKGRTGTTLGTTTVTLGPYELLQLDDIFGATGAPEGNAVWLEAFHDGGDGTFAVYGSVVDGGSGDAIFVPGRPRP